MPRGLTSGLQLIDLDIFSGLAGSKATGAKGSRRLMIWDTNQAPCAYYCKNSERQQIEPGAERYEDGVEETGGEDMAIEMGERALL